MNCLDNTPQQMQPRFLTLKPNTKTVHKEQRDSGCKNENMKMVQKCYFSHAGRNKSKLMSESVQLHKFPLKTRQHHLNQTSYLNDHVSELNNSNQKYSSMKSLEKQYRYSKMLFELEGSKERVQQLQYRLKKLEQKISSNGELIRVVDQRTLEDRSRNQNRFATKQDLYEILNILQTNKYQQEVINDSSQRTIQSISCKLLKFRSELQMESLRSQSPFSKLQTNIQSPKKRIRISSSSSENKPQRVSSSRKKQFISPSRRSADLAAIKEQIIIEFRNVKQEIDRCIKKYVGQKIVIDLVSNLPSTKRRSREESLTYSFEPSQGQSHQNLQTGSQRKVQPRHQKTASSDGRGSFQQREDVSPVRHKKQIEQIRRLTYQTPVSEAESQEFYMMAEGKNSPIIKILDSFFYDAEQDCVQDRSPIIQQKEQKYYIDKEGFLLDESQKYILDSEGNKIKLNREQRRKLSETYIIHDRGEQNRQPIYVDAEIDSDQD